MTYEEMTKKLFLLLRSETVNNEFKQVCKVEGIAKRIIEKRKATEKPKRKIRVFG